MPKAIAHFDADSLIQQVHQQDFGFRVTTNNPTIFKALIYKTARKLGLPIHIYSFPKRPNSFALMKKRVEQEPTHDS